ncbi:hypothetical protein EMIHUDRAFT_193880 [Emiliania huxleyi CCMP1516]|uniref:Uncharacterized protein n=2 Tax=Emiliania huxleyi TaxID=2903 RepID=A0A0D3L0K1_EMIH1|nr:hypothetical protein EMIHUDRAFT_193880 [Emiliania huxleyi CCMP1516]EOD41536.1 hypothetical protein EMIHUDRAFT_193880 [Emiliania huxleyi CCMP1516]|eukprot:XP_005793965.1 hypothetical protein EMIHUDRAFT_193880 [Emiliania huxleyi CCMP1516]
MPLARASLPERKHALAALPNDRAAWRAALPRRAAKKAAALIKSLAGSEPQRPKLDKRLREQVALRVERSDPALAAIYRRCFDTLEPLISVRRGELQSGRRPTLAFISTGDIPQMQAFSAGAGQSWPDITFGKTGWNPGSQSSGAESVRSATFDADWRRVVRRLLALMASFPELSREGRGTRVRGGVGLIWSGFTPGDDSPALGYVVPSNMLIAVQLARLRSMLAEGLELGGGETRDDWSRRAGFDPLRAPPVVNASEAYNATTGNPCFFEEPLRSRGEPALSGVGSLHTGPGKLWPMQGREEVRGLLRMLERVANTTPDGRMVESYSLVMKRSRSKQSRGGGRATAAGRDTAVFTRRLFGWADAIFVELIAWLALDVGFFEGRMQENFLAAAAAV